MIGLAGRIVLFRLSGQLFQAVTNAQTNLPLLIWREVKGYLSLGSLIARRKKQRILIQV